MLAVDVMGHTWTFIFEALALVLFVLAGIGFKPVGDRVHLLGLGLAAFVFPIFWDAMAGL
jgi:hypothetical protein